MAQPTELFKDSKAYFHYLSKIHSQDGQYPFEAIYKSGHTVQIGQVWADVVPYCVDRAAVLAADPTIVKPYTDAALKPISGSNGEAWYCEDLGNFITPWIAPVDVPQVGTKYPSFGFELTLKDHAGTIIPATSGVWIVDYYSGMVLFEKGSTPYDMGWAVHVGDPDNPTQPIQASFAQYVGAMATSGGGGGSANSTISSSSFRSIGSRSSSSITSESSRESMG